MMNFSVACGETKWIAVTGLGAGEAFKLQFAACEGCTAADTDWETYSPDGAPVVLDEVNNPISVCTPGRYRVVPDGIVSTGAKVCEIGTCTNCGGC